MARAGAWGVLGGAVLLGCTRLTSPEPPRARGGGPPAVARDPTGDDARARFARTRCAAAAACGDEGDGVDACRSRVESELGDWPRCERIDERALRGCEATLREIGCSYRGLPLVCSPEAVCR